MGQRDHSQAPQRAPTEPDIERLRRYRLENIRRELRAADYCGAVFFDPINIRYCTDSRNMQVWTLRNPCRYVFVATEGPVVMFEFAGCNHLLDGLRLIDEIRTATTWFYFTSGPRMAGKAASWAAEIADLTVTYGGGNRRLAVDRLLPAGLAALEGMNIDVVDGQGIAERARCRKSADEIACICASLAVCSKAVADLEAAIRPGLTENELWSVLHATSIAMGGEYIETRLLSSGHRTNPWYQETSAKVVAAGELVALDTDLIGPFGYFADMSRTFLCGDGKCTGQQRTLYRTAYEQIQHNVDLLRPGVSFREFAEKSWDMPEVYVPNRYMSIVHGAGLGGEYPYIPYKHDFALKGYDGIIEEGMVLCVESYIGSSTGGEGVKLEQPLLITAAGPVPLTDYPFDERLFGRTI